MKNIFYEYKFLFKNILFIFFREGGREGGREGKKPQ